MRDPRYSKPFPSWLSALVPLALIFIAILALTFSLGSLKDKMSSDIFSIASMCLTYMLIAMSLAISASMLGVSYSRHIITVLFCFFIVFAVFGHVYYYKEIDKVNAILGFISTALCFFAVFLANSNTYKSFILYRKMHFKSGKDYVESLKNSK